MSKQIGTPLTLSTQITKEKQILKNKRRSKRSQIKESFSCQCGKIYLSFSALYLHVKKKHNIRLTTNPGDQACTIQKVGSFSKYIYSIKFGITKEKVLQKESIQQFPYISESNSQNKKENNVQKTEQRHQKWRQFFISYIQKLEFKQQKLQVQKFLKYVLSEQDRNQKTLMQKIQQSPYHLNQYVLDFMPKEGTQINSMRWIRVCKMLQRLCTWMKQQNLTNLTVINDTK